MIHGLLGTYEFLASLSKYSFSNVMIHGLLETDSI